MTDKQIDTDSKPPKSLILSKEDYGFPSEISKIEHEPGEIGKKDAVIKRVINYQENPQEVQTQNYFGPFLEMLDSIDDEPKPNNRLSTFNKSKCSF